MGNEEGLMCFPEVEERERRNMREPILKAVERNQKQKLGKLQPMKGRKHSG